MKGERDLRGSGRGRFNQARRLMETAQPILVKDARAVTDADMATLRDLANDFGQAVHEFNAYRNALEWNDRDGRKEGN